MLTPITGDIILLIVCLTLIILSTVPALRCLLLRLRSGTGCRLGDCNTRYCDSDGSTSPDAETVFRKSRAHRIQFLWTTCGFSLSVATALHSMCSRDRPSLSCQWQPVFWLCLLVQSIACLLERNHIHRFALAMFVGASAMLIAAYDALDVASSKFSRRSRAKDTLLSCQIALATATAVGCALIPRRPDVSCSGSVVDRQYTVSTFERFSFSWAGSLITSVISNPDITDDELPRLDFASRSATLEERFNTARRRHSLTVTLGLVLLPGILQATALLLALSVLSFAPQVALFMLLRSLETRGHLSHPIVYASWGQVLILGVSMVLPSIIETWLNWISQSRLSFPLNAQLTAAIFSKATRLPTQSDGPVTSTRQEKHSSSPDRGPTSKTQKPSEEPTTQDPATLVAYDVQRISDFAAIAPMVPLTILKCIIACIFLKYLIGWTSMLAGVGTFLVTFPANILMSSRYAEVQMRLMAMRDSRTKTTTEFIRSIQHIKFSALEKHWQSALSHVRTLELGTQWAVFLWETGLIFVWILAPVMLAAVSLAVYVLTHGTLPPAIAFTALAVLGELEIWTALLPILSVQLLQCKASMSRINAFLNEPEVKKTVGPTENIYFEGAALAWPSKHGVQSRKAILSEITMRIERGGSTIIHGGTGSGKSLLLAAILGECDVVDGEIHRPQPVNGEAPSSSSCREHNWLLGNTIAFVPQNVWIEAGTLQENILFGAPYDKERYRKVLFACSLLSDLEALPDGDNTDLASNRVNLSGGQKMRVGLARALYSRADVLVLDEVFGSVDVRTRHHLVKFALTGDLASGRTRIMATHHLDACLHFADRIYCTKDGTVFEEDKGRLLQGYRFDSHAAGESADSQPQPAENIARPDPLSQLRAGSVDGHEERRNGPLKYRDLSKFVQAGTGFVLSALVVLSSIAYLVLFLGRGFWIALWTRNTEKSAEELPEYGLVSSTKAFQGSADKLDAENLFRLEIYLIISLALCVVGTTRYFVLLKANINASRRLFDRMLVTIIRVPLAWFDVVPIGRVINRFTADFQSIDSDLGKDLGSASYGVLQIFGIALAAVVISPVMVVPALILLCTSAVVCYRYLAAAREMKRLEAVARSPILSHLLTVVAGLTTIRGFGRVAFYIDKMHKTVDRRTRALWHLSLFNAWLSFRLNLIGAIFATLAALLIAGTESLDASLAGFALSFVLQFTAATDFALRRYASLELDVNALERVLEYTEFDIEDETETGSAVPAAWPARGRVEMCHVTARYKKGDPDVLRNVSLTLEPGQRLGVVGRTGAGKSSLILALFRLLDISSGSIYIDGIDISTIHAWILRSRLAIVPQDAVLFTGTVRYNLDPDGQFDDSELVDMLRRVWYTAPSSGAETAASPETHQPEGEMRPMDPSRTHCHDKQDESTHGNPNTTISPATASSSTSVPWCESTSNGTEFDHTFNPPRLDTMVSEGGTNFSHGERQLLYLVRGLIRRPKILVLDEATSALDFRTDAHVQRLLQPENLRQILGGVESSVLVVAHRLRTVADFDKVAVMENGELVDTGRPRDLLMAETKEGKDGDTSQEQETATRWTRDNFLQLVRDSGDQEVIERMARVEKR